MNRPDSYSATGTLRDGRQIKIRALRPDDRDALVRTVGRASPQSLYRRFFAVKRNFSEREADFFVEVDFETHVALVAETDEAEKPEIIGGGRYVVVSAGVAELAFTVIDEYQGRGLGTLLMRHLVGIAKSAGLKQLVAEVLPENRPMLHVFRKFGGRVTHGGDVDKVVLDVEATGAPSSQA